MAKKEATSKISIVEGLARISLKNLQITLNKTESTALKKAFSEEEEARKTNFVVRGAILP